MKISIIGAAGTVGSSTAYTLAFLGLAQELVMIDIRNNVLTSHVLDITAAMAGRQEVAIKAGKYEDLSGTDVVIIAAGLHSPLIAPLKERMVQNIRIMQEFALNIEKYCPESIVITVTNPSDIMNYTVYYSTSLNRKHLWGYNLNDSLRFQMITANMLGVQANRVEGIAGGYHTVAPVMLFSSIRISGEKPVLNEAIKLRIHKELGGYLRSYEALGAGRTAGWTTATGLAALVGAIRDDKKILLPCSAVLNGEYGYQSISLGIPAIIGREGISRIVEWELPAEERQELEAATNLVQPACETVREIIGPGRRQ